MSPPCAITSSRFWDVWALARAESATGAAPAAPRAAAPLSRSRRVSFMVDPPVSLKSTLRAAELEVEPPDLELLVRVRRPFHVLLEPIVLVGLDDREPREVLEEDLRHLLVRLAAELLVDREARRVAQLVELRIAPVVVRAARAEQPPHHTVRVPERRRRIAPPQAPESALAVLLRSHGELDHLDLDVDAHVRPHGRDRLGHGLVLGNVGDRRLDQDLLALVAGLLQSLARLLRVVGERRQRGIEVVVAF